MNWTQNIMIQGHEVIIHDGVQITGMQLFGEALGFPSVISIKPLACQTRLGWDF